MARKMDMEYLSGLMETFTLVSGFRIAEQVMEYLDGIVKGLI